MLASDKLYYSAADCLLQPIKEAPLRHSTRITFTTNNSAAVKSVSKFIWHFSSPSFVTMEIAYGL